MTRETTALQVCLLIEATSRLNYKANLKQLVREGDQALLSSFKFPFGSLYAVPNKGKVKFKCLLHLVTKLASASLLPSSSLYSSFSLHKLRKPPPPSRQLSAEHPVSLCALCVYVPLPLLPPYLHYLHLCGCMFSRLAHPERLLIASECPFPLQLYYPGEH